MYKDYGNDTLLTTILDLYYNSSKHRENEMFLLIILLIIKSFRIFDVIYLILVHLYFYRYLYVMMKPMASKTVFLFQFFIF